MLLAEKELNDAYKQLDRNKSRLRNIKIKVFSTESDKDPRSERRKPSDQAYLSSAKHDELGDAAWYKLIELQNEINFTYQEVDQLREQEGGMVAYRETILARLGQFRAREENFEKKNVEVRNQIKLEKEKHRNMSVSLRAVNKQDRKVFTKFVNAHDEK